jgi:Tat protein translocase TatB subunit
MFDIGIQELIVVFIVALMVFGPKRLPELGRTLGKFMLEIRKGLSEVKFQMESEFRDMEKQTDAQAGQQGKGTVQHEGTAGGTEDVGGKGEKA